MSFRAIDPDTGLVQSVGWFHEHRKKTGLCEVCSMDMSIRADASISTTVHFWHGIGSLCPSIKKNRRKYEDLPVRAVDPNAGKLLRAEVRENAYLIYSACSAIVDGMKWDSFKGVVERATEKGIWDYKGLTLRYVPYLLVTFEDMFYSKGSKLRDERFYIVLESGLEFLDDLWNKPSEIKQNVWKVSPDKGVIDIVEIKKYLDPEPNWFRSAKKNLKV
ncbi:hypothetical protein [Metapseudomonas otitidis]|uniref:hypothetical protein n=1 Tax=Metapseudomonas otitidis TaxID=319939 RepID=UPI000D1A5113|nr:hypothetical protein [Pseudomonas otitidis]